MSNSSLAAAPDGVATEAIPTDEMEAVGEDWFKLLVEGVLILVVGSVGLLGNGLSLIVYSKQKIHRIFHNLLFTLTLFDMIYLVCSILLFSLSRFNETYDQVYRVYMMPYLLPLAHVGLMGSVYCTLAMAIERFLTVNYPFLTYRHVYSSRSFIIPVTLFTLIYNIPKFLELNVAEVWTPIGNCTLDALNETSQGVVDELAENCTEELKLEIQPTNMRTNSIYIRVYILWMNLLVQIVIPFVLLIFLNIKIFEKIKEFEENFSKNIHNWGGTVRMRYGASCKFNNSDMERSSVGGGHGQQGGAQSSGESDMMMLKFEEDSSETAAAAAGGSGTAAAAKPVTSMRSNLSRSFKKCLRRSPKDDGQRHDKEKRPSLQALEQTREKESEAYSLRRREVTLARISLYIVVLFLICHGVRLFPNTFEMIQTYMEDYNPNTAKWPDWISRVTNLSHFLLTFACSANFFIYYAKHGQGFNRAKSAKEPKTNKTRMSPTTATTQLSSRESAKIKGFETKV